MRRAALAVSAMLVFASIAGTSTAAVTRQPAVAAMGQAPCVLASARPWCNRSLSAGRRARLLLHALSEPQRLSLLAGDNVGGLLRIGHTGTGDGIPGLVPTINLTDGTSGIRQGSATALPDELAVSATFDPSIAALDGRVLGAEAKLKGNEIVYAPTLTIMRTPLAGRTFQGIGEDPYLGSQIGVGLVRGIQSQGVIADANIYTANNQEGQDPTGLTGQPGSPLGVGVVGSRMLVDARVDGRTLREIYLPPFRAAVRQGHVGTVMCAYNLVNGFHNCANGPLLNGILEHDWKFKGFVLSDYGAALNTVGSLNAGLDFEPWPGAAYTPAAVEAALASGLVSQSTVDEHVFRYLRTLFAFGVFDRAPYTDRENAIPRAAHAVDAEKVEASAITLLKNRNGVLPLSRSRTKSIAVIGEAANQFLTGGGSSSVTPYSSVSALEGIRHLAGRRAHVVYSDGSDLASAVALAKRSSVAIVVAAQYQIEGADQACLTLECPNAFGDQDALIRAVAAANPRTVVVLETGGPVLTPWRHKVEGLLEAWFPGERGGAAIARVLFGKTDPSGHLPVTLPASANQEPTANDPESYPGVAETETYQEGVFVGYRWFDAHHLTPAYPFGDGLSYTSFRYDHLSVRRSAGRLTVHATVTNVGSRAGATVAQLYMGLPSTPGAAQPPKQLKGVEKIALRSGQSARVHFDVPRSAMSYWNVTTSRWDLAAGCYRVMVGDSSRHLPLRGHMAFGGGSCGAGEDR